MRSSIELSVKSLSVSNPLPDQRKSLTEHPLKLASANYLTTAQAKILVQTINQHLVQIDLYNYQVEPDLIIEFEITTHSFLMIVMLHGNSELYNNTGEIISTVSDNSCLISAIKKGNYKAKLKTSHHQVLVLTINPEWLVKKYGTQTGFHDLMSSFHDKENQYFAMPGFSIAHQLFNELGKLNRIAADKDAENEIYVFLNACLNRYMAKLHQSMRRLQFQDSKAEEIGKFIRLHYGSPIVDNETLLAQHFNVSQITLTRLAKRHFGRPLHKQVIELRIHHGLKLLLSTNYSVQQIAKQVGYDDPKYFSRAFKKHFGITPSMARLTVF